MLTRTDVRTTVLEKIEDLLLEDADEAVAVNGEATLAELSLNSLSLARLIISLESSFGADPFTGGTTAISDVRTVDDLVAAYEVAVHGGGGTGDAGTGV